MVGSLRCALIAAACIALAVPAVGCKPSAKKTTASTSPAPIYQAIESPAIEGAPAQSPTTNKYYPHDAAAVAESVIRGEHLFEWAQAVAFVRDVDPSGNKIEEDLRSLLEEGSAAEEKLATRFIRDVRAKDGPQWKEPMPGPALATAVQNLDSKERQEDRWVRYRIGTLKSTNENERIQAIALLKDKGVNVQRYLFRILPHLRAESFQERLATIEVLEMLATTSNEAVDAAATALNDPEATVRRAAVLAVARAPMLSSKTADSLAASMHDRDAQVRQNASGALARFVEGHPSVVAALVNAIEDRDTIVRQHAIDGFSRPDVLYAASTPALIAALRHPEISVRRDAAFTLLARKDEAEDILRALTGAVDHRDYIVREALADALEKAVRDKSTALAVLQKAADRGSPPTTQAFARAALMKVQSRKTDSK